MDYRKIKLTDADVLHKYIDGDDNWCCDITMGNLILWDPDKTTEWRIMEEYDVLIIRYIENGEYNYIVPDFKGFHAEVLFKISDEIEKEGKKGRLVFVPQKDESVIETISAMTGKFECREARDTWDYIYDVEKLAGLTGSKYHKKKNHLNKFMKEYDFSYEPISALNLEECRKVKNEWLENALKREEGAEDIKHMLWENKMLDDALNHYEALGFVGGALRVDGKVKAFTMGEKKSENMFVTHYEKADISVDGIYVAINQQFAFNELLGKYKYVNREDDMGMEGLRNAKLSYHPDLLYEKYAVDLNYKLSSL